jgi:hypothetical protein
MWQLVSLSTQASQLYLYKSRLNPLDYQHIQSYGMPDNLECKLEEQ